MFFRERQLARSNGGRKRVRTLLEGSGSDRGLPEGRRGGKWVRGREDESEHALTAFYNGLELFPSPLLCQNEKTSSEKNFSTSKTLCAISDLQTQTASSSPSSSPRSSTNAQISSFPVHALATPESRSNSLSTLHLDAVESLGLLARRVASSIEYAFAKSYHWRPTMVISDPQLISPPTGSLFPQRQNSP